MVGVAPEHDAIAKIQWAREQLRFHYDNGVSYLDWTVTGNGCILCASCVVIVVTIAEEVAVPINCPAACWYSERIQVDRADDGCDRRWCCRCHYCHGCR